ncbi:MAG: pyridoxal-phosphate dependent enzyme [Burkholderiales bacterium]
MTYIHGYDDAAIIAGQGTIALEILEQVHDIDAIVASIGGGGMIAGIARAVRRIASQSLGEALDAYIDSGGCLSSIPP